MVITQNLQKWGNSTGIRLPKKVIEAAHLRPNQALSISLKGRSILLTPIDLPRSKVKLDALLADITPDNIHKAVDWGPTAGNEQW